jgi:hypothetical protein
MSRGGYRWDEDQYREYRCTCLHLSSQHDAAPAGCWHCSDCDEYQGPVDEPQPKTQGDAA